MLSEESPFAHNDYSGSSQAIWSPSVKNLIQCVTMMHGEQLLAQGMLFVPCC